MPEINTNEASGWRDTLLQLAVVGIGFVAIVIVASLLETIVRALPLVAIVLLAGPWLWLVVWTLRKGGVKHRERSSYWLLAFYGFTCLFAYPLAIRGVESGRSFLELPEGFVGAAAGAILFWYCWWVRDVSLETVPTLIAADARTFFRRPGLFPVLLRFAILYWLAVLLFGVIYNLGTAYDQTAFSAKRLSLVDSMYFSGVTIATIGYGDIVPRSFWARALAITEAFLGIALIVTYLGAAVAFFQQSEAEEFAQKHDES
jgi:voltage-gated potassium channel Kch